MTAAIEASPAKADILQLDSNGNTFHETTEPSTTFITQNLPDSHTVDTVNSKEKFELPALT